jgi:deazaflavin-dependent oxidoreductase (nitroreductase family)
MGFNDDIIAEFRANGGKVGGNFEGAPLLLLHHKGIKSGNDHVAPLVYLESGGKRYIFGSYAGADFDPQWFKNIKAEPSTTIEVGTETVPVTATEITGPERDRLFAAQVEVMPGFADYEKKTSRVIPVIELIPA